MRVIENLIVCPAATVWIWIAFVLIGTERRLTALQTWVGRGSTYALLAARAALGG